MAYSSSQGDDYGKYGKLTYVDDDASARVSGDNVASGDSAGTGEHGVLNCAHQCYANNGQNKPVSIMSIHWLNERSAGDNDVASEDNTDYTENNVENNTGDNDRIDAKPSDDLRWCGVTAWVIRDGSPWGSRDFDRTHDDEIIEYTADGLRARGENVRIVNSVADIA